MITLRTSLALVGMAALLCACQQQVKDDDPYAVRERQLEARMDRMDQLSKNQGNQGVNLSQRLDDMQAQLQQMRGEIELLQHGQDLDKKQQRDLYQDLDKRLQKLEMGLSAANPAPAPATVAAPAAGTAVDASGSPDQALYQKALNHLYQGRIDDSIKGFKSFLKQYPTSPLASNAQYWMGDAYYQKTDFETAMASFRKVLKDYPSSNKAADAMAKVGYCQYELQQWKSARETLNAVLQKYPGTGAAKVAAEGLQRLQSEGH